MRCHLNVDSQLYTRCQGLQVMTTLQSDNRDSTLTNQARKSSMFRTGMFSDFGPWTMTHSGAHVAITGSTLQASQPLMNRLVVLRMLAASCDDILGEDIVCLVGCVCRVWVESNADDSTNISLHKYLIQWRTIVQTEWISSDVRPWPISSWMRQYQRSWG